MKKLLATGAAVLAAIPAIFAGSGRGAAAYLVATQTCTVAADGAIVCVPKETAGISAIVVIILIGVGILLWQKSKKK